MMLNSDELDSVRHKFSSSFQPSGVKHIFSGIVQSVEILQGHSAIALCGIAKPESFQKSLESCGVNIKEFFDFSDHHKFTTSEIDAIVRSFHSEKADFIFTTEKDTVRLAEFANELKQLPMFALLMDVTIHQHDEWKKYLLSQH